MVGRCETGLERGDGAINYHSVSLGFLETTLEEHRRWLQSHGKEGARADLSDSDLSNLVLPRTDLRKAILVGVNFNGTDLSFSDLSNAILNDGNLTNSTLRHANLTGVSFQNAQLFGADLYGADLREVDLDGVHGLIECQLGGTNLSNARLPGHMVQFSSLDQTREVSNQARNLLWFTIGACVISWMTLLMTSDGALLANSGSTLLPVIKVDVPIQAFFWLMPLVLTSLYFYLHFHLQDLWTELACLPAVFPDGSSLDQRVYLWLMTGLVRANVPFMKAESRPFSRSKLMASIVVVWGLVPITLFLFWVKYLGLHHVAGTLLHIVLLVASVWFGLAFHGSAVRVLKGETPSICETEGGAENSWLSILIFRRALFSMVALLLVLPIFSWIAFFRPWVLPGEGYPELLKSAATANLKHADISYRPSDWYRLPDNLREDPLIAKGAILENTNLCGARGTEAFLANSRLNSADLRYSDFSDADLRRTDFTDAYLQGANLRNAKLQAARLTRANLEKADLKSAELQWAIGDACFKGAILFGSHLESVILDKSCFWGANLCEAQMEGASLKCADLGKAKLSKADLRNTKLNEASLEDAELEGADLKRANFTKAQLHGATMKDAQLWGAWFHETELHGADLSEAKNLTAEQIQGACGDDKTSLPPGLPEISRCGKKDRKPCECK